MLIAALLLLAAQACLASPFGPLPGFAQQDSANYPGLMRGVDRTARHGLSRRMAAVANHKEQFTLGALQLEHRAAAGLEAVHAAFRRKLLRAATRQAAEQQEPQVVGGSPSWRSSRRAPIQPHHVQISKTSRMRMSSKASDAQYRSLLDGGGGIAANSPSNSSSNVSAVGSLPMDISTAPDAANSTDGSNATQSNPWYDQHVLGGGSSGDQAVLYQRVNASTMSSSGLDEYVIGTEPQPAPAAAPDPPPYEYPPVGRYPTVFFTVVLQGYSHPVGLGPAEQAAFSAAVNAFLAPTPGAAVSTTIIITQAPAETGLWMPCATSLLAGDVTVQDFLGSTLQDDPNLIFPTATWGTIRTVNIKEAQPSTPSTITYSWSVGDYGNCSALCGGGIQTRDVVCIDSLGNLVDKSACTAAPPASSRSCQEQPCQASLPTNFTLVLGDWGPCNSTCGIGSRTRTATCVSKEGYLGSLTNCYAPQDTADLWQQLWQPCTLPACPTYFWSYSEWVCNNTAGCGGGVASRTPTCMQDGLDKAVASTMCDLSALDTSTKPCATNPCNVYYWKSRELGDCLPEDGGKPCGRYIQRRRFDCVNMTSGDVVPNLWCSGPKPELGDVECQGPANCNASSVPAAPIQMDDSSSTGDGSNSNSGDGAAATDSSGPASLAQSAAAGAADSVSSSGAASGSGSAAGGSIGAGGGSADSAAAAADAPAKPSPSPNPASSFLASQGSDTQPPPAAGMSSSSSSNALSAGSSSDGTATSIAPAAGPSGAATSKPANSSSVAGGTSNSHSAPTPSPTPAPSTGVSPPISTQAGAIPNAGGGGGSSSSSTNGGSIAIGNSGPGSSVDPLQDLGPGQTLPDWLMEDPTPTLSALLSCPRKYAISADGKCCGGNQLDSKGACCDGIVDACGVCNGTGKAIDALGACCTGTLDAQGVCCSSTIDECGVCNGTSACDLKAEMIAALPSATLYLIPNSNANRRLRAAVQDAMAVALSAASGRSFDKMRLSVVLSAYTPPAITGKNAQMQGNAAISASEYSGDFPQQVNIPTNSGQPASNSSAIGFAAAATVQQDATAAAGDAPAEQQSDGAAGSSNHTAEYPTAAALAGDGAIMPVNSYNTYTLSAAPGTKQQPAGQPPMQLDTLPADDQQRALGLNALQVSTLQMNRTASTGAATSAAPAAADGSSEPGGTSWFKVERAAERILSTSMGGIKQLVNGLTESSMGGSPEPASSAAQQLSGSNSVVIGLVLHSGPRMPGPDTGVVLLALNRMVDTPVPVPGSSSKLTVRQLTSVVRSGACGDGVCQVNERVSYANPSSCPQDCALPFLSCPLGKDSQQPCSGKGSCYNSVGSCSCTTGYSGTDCSACALNYKLVNGYCVSAQLLAPPRIASTDLTTGEQMLVQVLGQPRSLLAGKLAVTLTTVCAMLLMLMMSRCVYNCRNDYLDSQVAGEIQNRMETYKGN